MYAKSGPVCGGQQEEVVMFNTNIKSYDNAVSYLCTMYFWVFIFYLKTASRFNLNIVIHVLCLCTPIRQTNK